MWQSKQHQHQLPPAPRGEETEWLRLEMNESSWAGSVSLAALEPQSCGAVWGTPRCSETSAPGLSMELPLSPPASVPPSLPAQVCSAQGLSDPEFCAFFIFSCSPGYQGIRTAEVWCCGDQRSQRAPRRKPQINFLKGLAALQGSASPVLSCSLLKIREEIVHTCKLAANSD